MHRGPMYRLVAIYARLSKDDVGEQTSTARQERLCREAAAARGWEVAEALEDVNRSAYTPGVVRDGYERLLDLAVTGRIDAILVWRLDRLVRSPAEFERLWAVCQRSGVALVSATEPVDSSDPVGVAIIRLLVTFAGLESDVRSIRLKAKNRELAESGHPPAGPRRFGFTAGFTGLVEAEASLIREAAQRVLAGESTTAIVRDWRQREVVGVTGDPWSTSGLRSMLRSRRLVGERTYRGEVVATGCWPTILDPLTAALVRNRLAGQAGGAQRRLSPSLLQGRVRCGLCRTPMHSRGRRDDPRYVCPPPRGCGQVSIDRPALDAWIKAMVVARLAAREPANHRAAVDRRMQDESVRCLDHQTAQLEELNRRYYVTAELTYPEWVRARDELLAVTEARLARSRGRTPPVSFPAGHSLGEAGALWDELSPAARQGVIATELAWVSIHPTPARNGIWYPERIEPRWHLPAPSTLPPVAEPDWPRRLKSEWLRPPGRPPRPSPALGTRDELCQLDRPLSDAEACVVTGLSPSGLAHARRTGRLPFEVEAGRRRYRMADLAAWDRRAVQRRRQPTRPVADRATPTSLSAAKAAAYLSVGSRTFKRLVAEGLVVPTEEGNRYTVEALQQCIERCRIQASAGSSPSSSTPGT